MHMVIAVLLLTLYFPCMANFSILFDRCYNELYINKIVKKVNLNEGILLNFLVIKFILLYMDVLQNRVCIYRV